MKMFISFFQNAKKSMAEKIIKDPELKEMAHRYIDAQTDFANMMIDNYECGMKYTFDKMSKVTPNEQKSV